MYPKAIADWDDGTKSAQQAATLKLMGDLQAAISRGDKQFIVPPGDYRFGGAQLPFFSIKAKDLEIKAEGANFWFSGRSPRTAVVFQDCSNVKFHGASFDADPFCNSQGQVLSLDPNTKTAVVRIDPGFPFPDAGWLGKPGSSKAIFYDENGVFRPTQLDWVKDVVPLGGNDCRVSFVRDQIFLTTNNVQVGDRLVFPDRSNGHVFAVNNSEKVTLEDITVYAAPHMAFTELGGSGGNVYRRCKVIRRPGTRRLLACNADVFHSIKVEHGPLIEQCEFSYACDDLINVHSFFSCVLEQSAPTDAVIVAFDLPEIEVGAQLTFYNFDTMQPLGEARVIQAKARPDLQTAANDIPSVLISQGRKVADIFRGKSFPVEVEMDRSLALPKFTLAASDRRIARGTIIRGNYLHDTIARGVFVKSEDGLIENNRIERTGMPGILLATDNYFWEGPPPRRMAVRHNQLRDVALSAGVRTSFNGMNAAICVGNKEKGNAASPEAGAVSAIQIEGNLIERTPVTAILLENARDCSIVNNNIVQLGFLPQLREATSELRAKAAAVYVERAQGIQIAGNTAQQSSPSAKGLIGLGPDTANCGPQK